MVEMAKVSVIVPVLLEDNIAARARILTKMIQKHGPLRTYPMAHCGEDCPILISDINLTDEEAVKYYTEIMEYHQCFNENLPNEEKQIRDQEVKEKWFNGNFSHWVLGEAKIYQERV